MNIGIHGKPFENELKPMIKSFFEILETNLVSTYFSSQYSKMLQRADFQLNNHKEYNNENVENLDLMITLGGDGTLLEAVSHIGAVQTPILGINTGRLGFLATTSKNRMNKALDYVLAKNYSIDKRSMLHLQTENDLFEDKNFALNDFTILKKDTSSMIVVHTYINGDFLNSYWADGIIVSTPTGSTGYSLSCGGPLILPQSDNFIITPVSPHNLTARPLVVPDDSEITLIVEGREDSFLVSLDSRFETTESGTKLKITKEAFDVKLVRLPQSNIFNTLRQKLHWGIDVRN